MNELNTGVPVVQTAAPQNMKIDDRAIKKMAGAAITQVAGVLCMDGNLADVLKDDDDPTRGLAVAFPDDGKTIQVSTRIIVEYGRNIPDIVYSVQSKVRDVVQSMASLLVDKVEVEVTDVMTTEAYQARTGRNRAMN